MAVHFPVPILVAGPAYCALYHPHRQAIGILSEGLGDYYGITWSDNEIFVLARNGGEGELVLVFDRGGKLHRILPIGRDIDGHQILYHQDRLLLTATRENAIIRLDPVSGSQDVWNWTGHTIDVNHLNGLAPGPCGNLLVSLDNGGDRPSEVVLVSPEGLLIDTLLTLTESKYGSHNIEANRIVASGDDSIVFDFAQCGEPRPVFRREGEFFRGLGRSQNTDGTAAWIVGSSAIMPREFRADPHTAWVHLFSDGAEVPLATLSLPDLGQVYEIRSLDRVFSHHGIPCPLVSDPDGITHWRDVSAASL